VKGGKPRDNFGANCGDNVARKQINNKKLNLIKVGF